MVYEGEEPLRSIFSKVLNDLKAFSRHEKERSGGILCYVNPRTVKAE